MNLRRFLPILALCLMTACQKDFDELNDTRQRWVAFTFDPTDYFSEVLVATEQGYELSASSEFKDGYGLRIVGYCYDADSLLVAKNTVFGDLKHELSMKFKHLYDDTQYHFLFIADIVKYDSEVDYYETWYQLMTSRFNDFYLISFDRSAIPSYNILLDAELDTTPNNQTIRVQMSQITYNGYCVLCNFEDFNPIDVSVLYSQSFYIIGMARKELISHNLGSLIEEGNSIVFPITASYADQSVGIQLKSYSNGLNSTTSLTLPNPERRPFVATINCETHQLANLTFY